MNKLIEDKKTHSQSRKHLNEILEIARLPTTINTLIHKNESNMAMKLINHFNENLYNEKSEILGVVKKEIDILSSKIQQKLNIELEEGMVKKDDINLLLGQDPSKDALKMYFHKKYKIRMDLLKQKLQKALFLGSNAVESKKAAKNETRRHIDSGTQIFKDALIEAEHNTEEQDLGLDTGIYKAIWHHTLVTEFSNLLLILLEKLGKDTDNIKYLGELKTSIFEIDPTVYYLIEEQILGYIVNSAVGQAKTLASKVTYSILKNSIANKYNRWSHIWDYKTKTKVI